MRRPIGINSLRLRRVNLELFEKQQPFATSDFSSPGVAAHSVEASKAADVPQLPPHVIARRVKPLTDLINGKTELDSDWEASFTCHLGVFRRG